VRPLLGGYYKWKDLGFPLVDVPEAAEPGSESFILRAEDIA
jgi:hypothetical protein